jgi:hypothetical protein
MYVFVNRIKTIYMEDFKNMDTAQLTDQLAKKTDHYMKMLKAGVKHEEFYACKKTIDQLALEIERRKQKMN